MRKKSNKQRTAHSGERLADGKMLSAIRHPLTAREAFTLIELLVAASILGLIGLAILTAFGSGLRVYDRVQSYGGVQADALLALEEMEKDLRNIFPSSVIRFEGDGQKIAFPAVIEAIETVDDEERAVSSVGRMLYYLEDIGDGTKALMSKQQNYSQAVAGAGTEEGESNARVSIDDIVFSYYFFDEEKKEYGWKDSWSMEEKNFPLGVKIELTFQDSSRNVHLSRTVFIPSVDAAPAEEEEEGQGEGEGA